MGAVDGLDSLLSTTMRFVVANWDSEDVFEMVLDGQGFNGRIRTDLWKDFRGNELYFDVVVSNVVDSMTRMCLSWLSDLPSIGGANRRCMKIPKVSRFQWSSVSIPGTVFILAFESISIGIGFNRVELENIE
jgi:hypothetical protein